MSVAAVRWALQVKGLRTADKVILIALADAANSEWLCWPSQKHLRDLLGMDRSNVSKGIKRLQELSMIELVNGQFRLVGHEPTAVGQGPTAIGQGPTPSRTTMNRNEPVKKNKQKKDHPGFLDFYSAYPRHVGRSRALQAWNALKPSAELRAAIAADMAKRDWGDEPKFIPHPSTYLNQRRWEDEPDPPSPANKRQGFDPGTYQPDWGDDDDTDRIIDSSATRVDRPTDTPDRQALAARPRPSK